MDIVKVSTGTHTHTSTHILEPYVKYFFLWDMFKIL